MDTASQRRKLVVDEIRRQSRANGLMNGPTGPRTKNLEGYRLLDKGHCEDQSKTGEWGVCVQQDET